MKYICTNYVSYLLLWNKSSWYYHITYSLNIYNFIFSIFIYYFSSIYIFFIDFFYVPKFIANNFLNIFSFPLRLLKIKHIKLTFFLLYLSTPYSYSSRLLGESYSFKQASLYALIHGVGILVYFSPHPMPIRHFTSRECLTKLLPISHSTLAIMQLVSSRECPS